LRVGDALDFWRVESINKNESLVLRAEMKMPGIGWLQFKVAPGDEAGMTTLVQTAYFAAHGLAGLLYWYAIYPIHGALFSTMIARIADVAEQSARYEDGQPVVHTAETT